MLNQETLRKLHALKLFGMAQAYENQLSGGNTTQLSFDELFGLCVDQEATFRSDRRLQRLLANATLREPACVEDIIYDERRGVTRPEFAPLTLCNWVRRGVNVLLTGPTGTGKTWLACALGNQACRFDLTVKFWRLSHLLPELSIARADGSFQRRLSQLAKLDLLILDDLGATSLSVEARDNLMEIVESRTPGKATILTSQFPVSHWHELLSMGNPTAADAILDRLTSAAHRVELKGESLRRRKKKDESESGSDLVS